MNPLKKAYCRIFQNVFKFALPLLPYRNPKIIGSVKGIPEVLEKRDYNNVLIITDAGIRSLGLTERLEQTLKRSCISYHIYDKTVANPTTVNVDEALQMYLDKGRNTFLKNEEDHLLFFNCSGAPMSRQGFWKVLKGYASRAGIEKDITPRMFRHSCAAHMAAGGAGLQIIREMLGHTDMAATQIYAEFQPGITTEYRKAHPRG